LGPVISSQAVEKPDHRNRRLLRDVRASALEFLILTVTRRSETLAAVWPEFDFQKRIWTIPAPRTKQRRKHRLSLSDRAMELLRQQPGYSDRTGFVFTNNNQALDTKFMLELLHELSREMGVHEKITMHGFRTSFTDWGDTTTFKDAHLEKCLAHLVGSKTRRAYDRDDSLEERGPIMDAWADYCASAIYPVTEPAPSKLAVLA
jgi:integrase